MDNFAAIENVEKVFGKLLSFAETCDSRLTEMGKGLNTSCEYGDIIAAARGQLRVLRRVQQRYIRRYALAVVTHQRLVNYFNDKFRLPGESDTEHRFTGWISGGFKDHWPSAIKNRLRRLNRRANKYRLQASLMRPRYQRTKKLHKLCEEAIEQARIDIAMHDTYHLAA